MAKSIRPKTNYVNIKLSNLLKGKVMAKTNVTVNLVGQDGNAFVIMGLVIKALKQAGHADLVKQYQDEAMSGDYDHLIQVTMDYVEVI